MKTADHFRALEFVRKVRDEQGELLRDRSPQNIIAFFEREWTPERMPRTQQRPQAQHAHEPTAQG